jgi:hypothetical protein
MSLASNLIFHAQTKHIEIDYHFNWEKVVNKDVVVRYINTCNQVADIFTKGHTADHFCILRDKLLVCSLPTNLREDVKDINPVLPTNQDTWFSNFTLLGLNLNSIVIIPKVMVVVIVMFITTTITSI